MAFFRLLNDRITHFGLYNSKNKSIFEEQMGGREVWGEKELHVTIWIENRLDQTRLCKV